MPKRADEGVISLARLLVHVVEQSSYRNVDGDENSQQTDRNSSGVLDGNLTRELCTGEILVKATVQPCYVQKDVSEDPLHVSIIGLVLVRISSELIREHVVLVASVKKTENL